MKIAGRDDLVMQGDGVDAVGIGGFDRDGRRFTGGRLLRRVGGPGGAAGGALVVKVRFR